MFENQAGISFSLVGVLILSHICLPSIRPFTSKFVTLGHYNHITGKYGASSDDFLFMSFCVVLFTGLRAGIMDHVLVPLARRWGVTKQKDMTRFAEQAWLLCYYNVFWPLGMYIYCNSPYFMNLTELWTNWPDRELDGVTKAYVLAQLSFWLQQLLVIHLESRRKDHYQMLAHHFVTITLIYTSYAYHHTRVANLILVLMDVVDLFFPLAKCLKYLGYNKLCDYVFGLFIMSWVMARHVFYLMVCWSIYADVPNLIQLGCYTGRMGSDDFKGPLPVPEQGWSHMFQPFYDPEGMVCYTENTRPGFLFCLLLLQALTIMWFALIVRVAVRVLRGGSAEDVRSDDEGEEEEMATVSVAEGKPMREESKLRRRHTSFRGNEKRASRSSGITLPGRSARKELLNRIGCEKQID